ncbi:MAG: hypothetical protein AAGF22_12995 [Pseudomonadota bacterium]
MSYVALRGYVRARTSEQVYEFKGLLVWLGQQAIPNPEVQRWVLFAGFAWGFVCLLAVSVRRLRDVGSSPFLLLGPPAFVGMAVVITYLGGADLWGRFYLVAIFGSVLFLVVQMLRRGAGGIDQVSPEVFD